MTSRTIRLVAMLIALILLIALLGCTNETSQPTVTPPVPTQTPMALATVAPPLSPTAFPTPTFVQTPAPGDSRAAELVQSIVNMIVSGTQTDWLIAQVDMQSTGMNAPLERSEATMRQCWVWEAGQAKSIGCTAMLELSKQEQKTPRWKHGVADFAIVSVNPDYSRAVIRLDSAAGPMMGSGWLITLVKREGKWQEESRQGVWIS